MDMATLVSMAAAMKTLLVNRCRVRPFGLAVVGVIAARKGAT